MAEAAQQFVDIDPDFEPQPRPRSCTWPLPRPELINPADSGTSSPAPSVKQEPVGGTDFIGSLSLLEEAEDFPEEKGAPCGAFQCRDGCAHQQQQQHPNSQLPQQVAALPAPLGSSAAAQRKSGTSRRNAWGNMSYADLITKAIESSPEKRLTLSQIYDWMVRSVPYFMDKGDSNSSAGWKVSAGTRAHKEGLQRFLGRDRPHACVNPKGHIADYGRCCTTCLTALMAAANREQRGFRRNPTCEGLISLKTRSYFASVSELTFCLCV